MRAANYVEETTTSIAGTLGDGAITLTAIANTPRFSTVFGSQATTFRYVIEDTVNKKFETGIGSVASNVLTRTLPQITWNGTTYGDSTPVALQFGSTPTSGNIKIRMSATAASQSSVNAGANRTVAGDTTWRDYPLSANMVSWASAGTGATLTASREYYTYYRLDRGGLLDGVQFEVTTGVAGNMKLALYAIGSNGLPGAKIVDFTTTAVTVAGIKTDTATASWSPTGSIWLAPGEYAVGFISDVAAVIRHSGTSSGGVNVPTPYGRAAGGYGYGNTVYASGNYATGLPAVAAAATMIAGNSSPHQTWIGLRVTP